MIFVLLLVNILGLFNTTLTYSGYFLGYPQLCLTSDKNAKDINKSIYIRVADIRNTCARDTYVRNIYARGICTRESCIKDIYIKNTYAKGAYIKGADIKNT